jgi:hypothetical protein
MPPGAETSDGGFYFLVGEIAIVLKPWKNDTLIGCGRVANWPDIFRAIAQIQKIERHTFPLVFLKRGQLYPLQIRLDSWD